MLAPVTPFGPSAQEHSRGAPRPARDERPVSIAGPFFNPSVRPKASAAGLSGTLLPDRS